MSLIFEPITKDLDLFVRFDPQDNSLKTIRKLDSNLLKKIEFKLSAPTTTTHDSSSSTDDIKKKRFAIHVNDINDNKPELELDQEDIKKYGENLVITSIEDFTQILSRISKTASSTHKPMLDIPAVPEVGILEGRPAFNSPFATLELRNNADLLHAFNKKTVIKAYKISDPDSNNVFSAAFNSNSTNQEVLDNFIVRTNQTHLIIEKKLNQSEITQSRNKFTIELSDGVNKNEFRGEIINIDPSQLERLLINKPINGRYSTNVYKFSDESHVDFKRGKIRVDNQFPYDIHVQLSNDDSKYFLVEPKLIKSGVNMGIRSIDLLYKEPLANLGDELKFRNALEFEVNLRTKSNEYLDDLLKIIGTLKIKLSLVGRNEFEPRLAIESPLDGIIKLKEGIYENLQIAKVHGVDRDRQSPDRLEYHLIGNSKLFNVNIVTGVVNLTGNLDAESEQIIEFYVFARDMEYKPLGKFF
jgi:hypothetical protein